VNFLELQNEVLAHGFDQSVYRLRVQRWLNEAQARIARILELPNQYVTSTITTVVGTDTYNLPSDVVRINGVTNASSPNELTYVEDAADINYNNQAGQSVGEPQYYTLSSGTTLRLSPIPDAVYSLTLDYYKAPSALSADTDVSAIPSDYHDVMISYALSRAYRSEDDMQMSQFFYAEFMRDLQMLGADRQFVVRDGPRQVPGMWNL
jgi:hypothetical protein